jgi:hypothetical protein
MANRGPSLADVRPSPQWSGVSRREIAYTSAAQGGPLRLLGHLPLADPLELLASDAVGDLGHRVQADVAAVGQHDGQEGAHVFCVTSTALGRGHEVIGEAQVII